MKDKDESKSGATRNKISKVRYDLLELDFLKDMAGAMSEGEHSHGENNWRLGFDNQGRDIENHIWNHWEQWKSGCRKEAHLAKMAVGLMFLHWFDNKEPKDED